MWVFTSMSVSLPPSLALVEEEEEEETSGRRALREEAIRGI